MEFGRDILPDLRDATPRSGVPKIQRTLTEAAPAQQQKDNISSAAATTRASVGLQEPGVAESQRSHKHQTANYNATSVRLCNNQLANLEGLEPALAAVLDDPVRTLTLSAYLVSHSANGSFLSTVLSAVTGC